MRCICPHIIVGHDHLESKNWNPACEQHGWESEWYNSEEQKRKRLIQYTRTTELQRIAKERRNGTISAEEAKHQVNELDEELKIWRKDT